MPTSTLERTRKQIYDEVWQLSVSGMAKKYGIPYAKLMKRIKDAGIPIPPSGYWTKLNFGKTVEQSKLTGDFEAVVVLSEDFYELGSVPSTTLSPTVPQTKAQKTVIDSVSSDCEPKNDYDSTGQEQIGCIYDRETLYQKIWAVPVMELSQKYGITENSIYQVCKALDIPVPQAAYWKKLRAGKAVDKKPLPDRLMSKKQFGAYSGLSASSKDAQALSFLDCEERAVVIAVVSQILLPHESDKMHPKIIAYRRKIKVWEKENRSGSRLRARNESAPPMMTDTISSDSVPRACYLLDALIKAMEPLGCSLTDQLDFVVNGEIVSVSFAETQDKVEHILTAEENRKLLEYEENRRRYTYASKPQIRKYDYRYNGRLSIMIDHSKTFRDHKAIQLESRLGDIMLELYIAAEHVKQRRIEREDAERKRKEEQRKREELRIQYNQEIDRTLALVHLAEDYDAACKIRQYIDACIAAHPGEDLSEWAAWAMAKADWYDPTVAREDTLLGKRDHGKGSSEKTPKYKYW